jgi:hypothetical protein
MKTIDQLYNWFYLDKKCANSKISNCSTSLRVAPIKKVDNYEFLEIDHEHFAFAEKNENWEIEYFHGLKNFLWIERNSYPPIAIFDNHNHAVTFRYNIIYIQKIKNIELIHIDQHSDNWENKNHLKLNQDKNELEIVFKFCNEKCNVWNFITPAIECWIIKNQRQIRSTTGLKNLKIEENQKFILDIDLDFCLNWINRNNINNGSVELLKNKFDKFRNSASLITIATSPYFIKQELSIDIINYLLS